jgi:hypothetical protein
MEMSTEQPSPTNSNSLSKLVEEHRNYSRKLESILSHPYLSESEQQEAIRLKKLKLSLKDKMQSFARKSNSQTMNM